MPLTVPLDSNVAVKLVNVPPPDNVIDCKFNVVAANVNAVVPKFNDLNQLPVVNVGIAVPNPVKVKFGALDIEPAVVPNVNVLVTDAAAVNPPVVAVSVSPVTPAISTLVAAAVVVVSIILLVPNDIVRVFVLAELNVPTDKLPPFNVIVPAVKKYALVVLNVNAAVNVNVPAVCINDGVVIALAPEQLNVPEVKVKLVLALIVPLLIVSEPDALIVQVVQDIVPILVRVPDVKAIAPELVKLNVAKLISPAV